LEQESHMGVLEGRVAIITGGAGGIGSGTARRFTEEGATVVLADVAEDRVKELAAELTATGARAIGLGCDVAKASDIQAVVDTTIAEYGKVDILVNLAQGGMGEMRYLDQTTIEDATYAFVTGPLQSMLFMQYCLPHMKERRYGRIINVSSQSSVVGAPGFAPYEMAKGAISALTRNASQEWGQYGIVTNCFLPAIKTPAYDMSEQGRAAAERLAAEIPVRYFGTPYEDCAPLLVFLASQEAGYINGQAIAVDGGRYLIA